MWGRFPTFFYSRRLPRRDVKDALEDVVLSELDAVGYDLVELRRGGTQSRPLIEVRIDRRDGVAVTVDDCARASRALEARLDGSELVSPQYVLQVSSPGERPLRTPGRLASVCWAVGERAGAGSRRAGSRERSSRWRERQDGGRGARAQAEGRVERRIPLADVKEARLAFHL